MYIGFFSCMLPNICHLLCGRGHLSTSSAEGNTSGRIFMVVYVSVWQVHTYPSGFSHTLLTLICRIDIWHPSLISSRRGVGEERGV